ncbi:MAG: hypothetical protein EB127_14145 [Alphaproteobacteria bacterium]|nr:hypothetical protein [Alphaproteobacteria bacterium]
MVSIKAFHDGGFPKKVLALTSYDSTLLRKVHSGKNRSMIEAGAAKLVMKYFESYVDAKARSNRLELQHVYEFDMPGNRDARLFKGTVTPTPVGAVINFSFKTAKKPNKFGYSFPQKASVMESGQTVTIKAVKSKYLSYRLDDGRFVRTSKTSVVTNPGGDVKNNFSNEFKQFQSYQAKRVLKDFGYFERVNANIKMKRRMIAPRINSMALSNYAAQAAADADQIAFAVMRST